MSSLTAPVFEGDVVQCEDVVVSWTGGVYPVRVEAFYQPDATSDWKIAGLPSEAANSNVIRWNANVPAGSYAWITIIDHNGQYRQTSQGVMVQGSSNSSCLDAQKTASVITQTVFMAGDGQGSEAHLSNGLDDKALLILSICFGILAFGALALATFLFSRLRQARRARGTGPRFSLAEDEYLDGGSAYDPGSRRGSAIAAAKLGTSNSTAFGAAGAQRYTERTIMPISESVLEKSHPTQRSSVVYREKTPPSPDTSYGEHNPFLDPPLSAASDQFETTAFQSPRQAGDQLVGEGEYSSRPEMSKRYASRSDTVSSATSMQIFDSRGQLRVANDPTQIATPTVSRQVTRSSLSSAYPASGQDDASSIDPERRTSVTSDSRVTASNDGHSLVSSRSTRSDQTADHYTSEPQSSRGWLNVSRQNLPQ